MYSKVSLIAFSILCTFVGATFVDSGKCSYRFDVWKPDQDVTRRLDIMDGYQKNLTSHFNLELLRLRNDVLNEILSMKNVSHQIEKEVLQQKVENVKLRISQQEMQINFLRMKEQNVDMKVVEEVKVNQEKDDKNSQLSHFVTKLRTDVASVQNSIGDLRAEWLLIKREIQKLRNSDHRLTQSNHEMVLRLDTVQTMVAGMSADSLLIKRQQNDLMSENNGLGKKVMHVQQENDELKQFQTRIRKSNSKIQENLHRLRAENNYLHASLKSIDEENDNLRAVLGDKAKNISKYEFDVKAHVPTSGDTDSEINSSDKEAVPRDCDDLYKRGHVTSGQYRLALDTSSPTLYDVYCDMYNNSGWLVVQRRVDGLLSFKRRWLEYKFGFGNLYAEFWFGNEYLFKISNSKKYVLRIEMWDWEGAVYRADYNHFIIESEKEQYRLHVNGYHGTAGDSLSYHNDMGFSTEDTDNDLHVRNCAADYKGGWWYHTCYSSNLNGLYHTGWYSGNGQTFSDGVVWYTLKDTDFYSLRKVEMKLKPLN